MAPRPYAFSPEFEIAVEAFDEVGLVVRVKHTLNLCAGLCVVSFAQPDIGFRGDLL